MPALSESRSLRYFSFFYLYVMQGIPSGFALTAVTNYLAAEGLDARAIATFGAVIGLPWGVKFLWGPLVDRYQGSAMGRRRPWVLAAQCLAFLASFTLFMTKDPVADFDLLMWSFVFHGVFASLQDVSVDALAITVVPLPERGRANALMKGGMVTGQAIGAAGLALILHHGGFQTAAMMQSGLLLGLTIVTFFIREQPGDALLSLHRVARQTESVLHTSFVKILRELKRALLTRQSLLLFFAVAAIFLSERLFQRVYFLHLIQKLGWSDTSVSVLSGTYGAVVAVGLALVGGWLSDRLGARRMLLIVAVAMGLMHAGFSAAEPLWADTRIATAAVIIRQTLEPIFSIAALPALMSLCRLKVAGAQFAFYMALSNQADVLGIYLSGPLYTNFSAPLVGIGCGLVMLAAAALIGIAGRPFLGKLARNEVTYEEGSS